ncbi:MAG: hypothetical protein QG567_2029 [Campylobacterota bacterium]|nr:hypothetical protein [Campylobacterota bacterium]
MSVQPKLITLNDFNPRDTNNPFVALSFVKFIGGGELLVVINDEVLKAIIEVYGEDGEKEIVRMVDRGQVFISQAERVLGLERYKEVGKSIPCEWE